MSISSRGKLSGTVKGDNNLKGSMGMGNPTKGAVKSINGIGPDKNGNVELDLKGSVESINGIGPDENGNVTINIPECKVQSVNGISPDGNGNVTIEIPEGKVQTVNGVEPDEDGNIELEPIADDSEMIDMLIEVDMLPVVNDIDGAILTDENSDILLW